MLRPLFLKAAGRSMALTNQPCNRLARKRSENVSGSPMSSTKLSSHSSRNAKLRPNWKTKLSSFRRRSKGSRRRITGSSSEKRGELFIRAQTETLPVSAMCIGNPDRSPSESIAEAAKTPTGFTKIVPLGKLIYLAVACT